MSSKAASLRLQVESVLAGRLASPFQYHDRRIVETVPAGIPPIDDLTGGLPRGSLTEIYGPPSSGKTSFLISTLASRTAASEVCALVDARDAFDPHSAEIVGVKLNQLVWVRCRNADQALRATDLLIQGGGFGLIALDLSDTPPHVVRSVPLPVVVLAFAGPWNIRRRFFSCSIRNRTRKAAPRSCCGSAPRKPIGRRRPKAPPKVSKPRACRTRRDCCSTAGKAMRR